MDIAVHMAKFSGQTAGRDKIYRYWSRIWLFNLCTSVYREFIGNLAV